MPCARVVPGGINIFIILVISILLAYPFPLALFGAGGGPYYFPCSPDVGVVDGGYGVSLYMGRVMGAGSLFFAVLRVGGGCGFYPCAPCMRGGVYGYGFRSGVRFIIGAGVCFYA